MYHSITFGDKNTWDDWHLIPNGRPIFAPPTQKTNFLDVPGANGSLDMSEALTGYPTFNNREGSFQFIVMNKNAATYPECDPLRLDDIVSEIMLYLHGQSMSAVLEDDPRYKYDGRFTVQNVTPGADWSTIEIGYNVAPYKHVLSSTTENWKWDPFNFQTGVIHSSIFANISVTGTTEGSARQLALTKDLIGDEPVCPKFIVSTPSSQCMYIKLVNPTLGINKTVYAFGGTYQFSDIILYGDNVTLSFWMSSGTGTVSVDFYQGRF